MKITSFNTFAVLYLKITWSLSCSELFMWIVNEGSEKSGKIYLVVHGILHAIEHWDFAFLFIWTLILNI